MLTDTRRHLIALALLVVGAASANMLWSKQAPAISYHVDFKRVPMQVAGLQGAVVPIEKRVFDYLGADAMQEYAYTDSKHRVDVTLVYGTDWRAVHSPLSCLPQQGWQVDRRETLQLTAPSGCPHPGPINGQMLLAHKPDGREQVVLYVFAHKGGTNADWIQQGWEVARQPKGSGGLMVLLSTSVARGEDKPALALLKEVFSSVYLPAVGFWYQ